MNYTNPNKKFSFSFYGTYISSTQLQNNANATDPIERNTLLDLNGGFGYGGEFDYKPNLWNLDLTFYVSSEYFKMSESDLYLRFEQDTNVAKIQMTEQFSMIPLEIGAKWDLPVSSSVFKIYIGGGAGFYFGDRTRTLQYTLSSYTSYKKAGFSMNILTGMEYYLKQNLAANLEMKFREGYFDVESRFNTDYINVNGVNYLLDNPVYSRIIIDGVRVSLGLKYNF